MKKAPSLLLFTLLRLLFFIVPFGLMMLLPIFQQYYWLSAIFAALIGLSLSFLFLRRPFDASNTPAAKPKVRQPRADDAYEDEVTGAAS